MANKWALIVVAVLGCGDGLDPELDELSSAATDSTAPVINSVKTGDGFRQIRQDSLAHLVIRGNDLGTTTSVTIGTLAAEIESVTSREVRVSVFAPPGLLGRFDVTVVTADGTATRPEAIRVTPWVVAPDGAVGNHGTFQSPMKLCGISFDGPLPGDTLQLLEGTYQCSHVGLNTGTSIKGAGRDKTFVQVVELEGSDAMSDLTLQGPGEINAFGGRLIVERVNSEGLFFVNINADVTFDHCRFDGTGTALQVLGGRATLTNSQLVRTATDGSPAIIVGRNGSLTLDHVTYEGPGTALDVLNSSVQITNSAFRHCGPADGIRLGGTDFQGSFGTLDHVVVEDCDRGLVMEGPRFEFFHFGILQVTNSKFIDNRVGIAIRDGSTRLEGTVIRDDETTPRASEVGIAVDNGNLTITGGKITGHSVAGISVMLGSGPHFEPTSDLNVTGILIQGSPVGIDFRSFDGSDLFLQNSTIRHQTVASVRITGSGADSVIAFGGPDHPGMNALSTVSGFALDDLRTDVQPRQLFLQAQGTTLNGVSFDGQTIEGPAALPPYYRTTNGNGGIQF